MPPPLNIVPPMNVPPPGKKNGGGEVAPEKNWPVFPKKGFAPPPTLYPRPHILLFLDQMGVTRWEHGRTDGSGGVEGGKTKDGSDLTIPWLKRVGGIQLQIWVRVSKK